MRNLLNAAFVLSVVFGGYALVSENVSAVPINELALTSEFTTDFSQAVKLAAHGSHRGGHSSHHGGHRGGHHSSHRGSHGGHWSHGGHSSHRGGHHSSHRGSHHSSHRGSHGGHWSHGGHSSHHGHGFFFGFNREAKKESVLPMPLLAMK